MEDLELLENKIYSMSNSFLPLDMFFNDIRLSNADYYDKERAYKDIEIIADFIIDLQQQLDKQKTMWETLIRNVDKFADKQLAIKVLEKVNEILTDIIIEVTQNEFDLNKLCYLEEISAKFCEKIQAKIKDLKG